MRQKQKIKRREKAKRRIIGIGAAVTAMAAAVALGCLYYWDYTVEWNVPEHQEIVLEYGQPYKEEPAAAEVKGHVFRRNGKALEVKKDGQVDADRLGTYEICYETSYHGSTYSVTKTVKVEDTTAPVLTLMGDADIRLEAGEDYAEPGFLADDLCDGDLSEEVAVEGVPEVLSPGKYTLIYQVRDHSGNEAEARRTLQVVDSIPPKLELSGEQTMELWLGNPYHEPGYSAWDVCEGDCTGAVTVEGSVDTDKPGSYTLTYSVSDSSGNCTSLTRTVKVYAPPQKQSADTGNKVIYLTFDDGPGPYTAQLLDILDRYGVKATFFVTGAQANYRYLIAQEAEKGHTVAMHTYSHEYASVYQSTENYFADLQAINDVITEQTGQTPWLLRFPGGSSNMVSAKYCQGIMSRLTAEVEMRGYQYCDWNVSSGDAGETTDTSEVAANVIEGVKSKNTSVVLQHDIKSFSVDAVEQIIQWGLANGYTFLPITNTTPMVHHHIQN